MNLYHYEKEKFTFDCFAFIYSRSIPFAGG